MNHDPGLPGGQQTIRETLQQQLAELEKLNEAKVQDLARQGQQLTQDSVTNVRLQILVEHLLGDTESAERLAYEIKVQETFREHLSAIQSQVTQARLLQGVNGAKLPRRP